jgi:hypothetical protein
MYQEDSETITRAAIAIMEADRELLLKQLKVATDLLKVTQQLQRIEKSKTTDPDGNPMPEAKRIERDRRRDIELEAGRIAIEKLRIAILFNEASVCSMKSDVCEYEEFEKLYEQSELDSAAKRFIYSTERSISPSEAISEVKKDWPNRDVLLMREVVAICADTGADIYTILSQKRPVQ